MRSARKRTTAEKKIRKKHTEYFLKFMILKNISKEKRTHGKNSVILIKLKDVD